MKQILSLLIAVLAFALPSVAQQASKEKSAYPISLKVDKKNVDPKIKRSPIIIPVEATYDSQAQIISIHYSGEETGEVSLYLDGSLVDCSAEINTTFSVSEPGEYIIEIETESWIAVGYLYL